jgi:hypothetical protein
MDEVTIAAEPEVEVTTRVHLRPAVAIAIGLILGIGVGIAVASALVSVGKTYTEPAGVLIEQDEAEDEPEATINGTFIVVEE